MLAFQWARCLSSRRAVILHLNCSVCLKKELKALQHGTETEDAVREILPQPAHSCCCQKRVKQKEIAQKCVHWLSVSHDEAHEKEC